MKRSNYIQAFLASTVILISAFPSLADAKQTSLDTRIMEAFQNIDKRTNTHEEDLVAMQARREALAARVKDLREKISKLPDELDEPDTRKRRRELRAKIINYSAEYLNQSYKILNSAAEVISANLTDIAKLAEAVRNSPDSKNGALQLQNRIQKQKKMGRSMRKALGKLHSWAQKNPAMTGRFKSLYELTKFLDYRISADKQRLKSQSSGTTGVMRTRRQHALDATVDRLGNMFVQVQAEKASLKNLSDELTIVIELGRLEITMEMTESAIPWNNGIKAPTTDASSFVEMAETIGELNTSLNDEVDIDTFKTDPEVGHLEYPGIGEFKNF